MRPVGERVFGYALIAFEDRSLNYVVVFAHSLACGMVVVVVAVALIIAFPSSWTGPKEKTFL